MTNDDIVSFDTMRDMMVSNTTVKGPIDQTK